MRSAGTAGARTGPPPNAVSAVHEKADMDLDRYIRNCYTSTRALLLGLSLLRVC
jgi:hypothetical protein